MSIQVPVATQSGQQFFVEVEGADAAGDTRSGEARSPDELRPRGTGMGTRGAADRVLEPTLFSKAVDVIRGVSEDVTTALLHTEPRPSEVELSLNLGFDAGGNVWLLKGSASATLRLTLKWRMP